MADGLYMPDGSYRPFSAAELSTALATRQNAGVFYGELEGWLSTLPDPDPVLRRRGDDASILAELSADDQVATAMLSRFGPERRRARSRTKPPKTCLSAFNRIWNAQICAQS